MGDYDRFAEYISVQISNADVQSMNIELGRDEYTDRPDKVLTKLDEFFLDKWDRNASGTVKQMNARKNNFEKFLNRDVLTPERTQFRSSSGKKIDFDPLLDKYYEESGLLIPKREDISKKVKKITKLVGFEREEYRTDLKKAIDFANIGGEVELTDDRGNILTKQSVDDLTDNQLKKLWLEKQTSIVKDKQFVKQQEKLIKNLQLGGAKKLPDLFALRDSYRRAAFLPENLQPAKIKQLKKLHEEADQALQPYEKILTKRPTNKDALKKALASLTGASEERLERLSQSELKANWDYIKNRKISKKSFFTTRDDIPEKEFAVKSAFKEANKRVTKKIKEKAREDVLSRHTDVGDYLMEDPREYGALISDEELEKETNKRLISQVTKEPVADRQIEEVFQQQKYGDAKRNLSFWDRYELVKTPKAKLNKMLKSAEPNKSLRVPEEAVNYYKTQHKESVLREKELFDEAKKRETKRIKKLIRESIKEDVPAEFRTDVIEESFEF